MRTRAQRRNTISSWYMVVILCLLGLTMGIGLWTFSGSRAELAKVKQFSATPDPAVPVAIDQDSLKVTVQPRIVDSTERPLWLSTRRPYVEPELDTEVIEPTKPEETVIPALDAQLNSVILANEIQMIFLSTAEGVVRLEPGMRYNGWQLDKINEDSAEFHFDEEKKVLQLRPFAVVEPQKVRTLGQQPEKAKQ